MTVSWLLKNRLILFALSIQLVAMSFFPYLQKAEAAANDGGFIIQADRVVGENMTAMIVTGETSGSNSKPMLRIRYDSVQIYGMKLTKQFQTGGGMVSISMKADGPVSIKGMQVDTTAISFKGACVHAAKLIPSAALENVTMVAHTMTAEDSSLDQLQLKTVNGDGGVQKPGTLKILTELSSMPLQQMKTEITKITKGQLPLTCDGNPLKEGDLLDGIGAVTYPLLGPIAEAADPLEDTVGKITDPLEDTVGKVTDPLEDTIGKVTDPLKDTVGKITYPLKDTVGKVTDPLKDTVGAVTDPLRDTAGKVKDDVVEPVVGKVTEPVKETVKTTTDTAKAVTQPVVEPVKETVDQTAKTACEKLSEANGQITKELGLELIDQALKENKTLVELCPADSTLSQELESFTEGLLDSLGLLSLLGLKPSEEEQLNKMKDAILKEPDGSILPFD